MSIDRSNYEIYFIDHLDGSLSEADKKALDLFLEENPDLAAELYGELPVLKPNTSSLDVSELLKPLEWDESEVTELFIAQLEAKKDGEVLPESDQFRLKQFEETFTSECKKLSALVSKTELVLNSISELKERAKLGLLKLETDAPHTELIAYLEGDLTYSEVKNIEEKLAQNAVIATELELFRKTYLPKETIALPVGFKTKLKRRAGLIVPLWVKSVAASAAAVVAVVLILNGDGESSGTTAFTPRTSIYKDLSYDDAVETEEALDSYENNLAEVEREKAELENDQVITPEDAAVIPYEVDGGLVAENPDNSSNGTLSSNELVDNTSEELIAMTPRTEASYLPSKATYTAGKLVSTEPIEYLEIDINELPLGDDLAEVPSKGKEALTPFEFLERKVQERLAKDAEEEQGMALAFVNRTAKRLSASDEGLIAYEKEEKSKKGFKFRLGKLFSVERSN
ncbi:MAG: hypothetical protein AB8B53_02345 [Flavobacteriales bacterium]